MKNERNMKENKLNKVKEINERTPMKMTNGIKMKEIKHESRRKSEENQRKKTNKNDK